MYLFFEQLNHWLGLESSLDVSINQLLSDCEMVEHENYHENCVK